MSGIATPPLITLMADEQARLHLTVPTSVGDSMRYKLSQRFHSAIPVLANSELPYPAAPLIDADVIENMTCG
jgi:hypothetical protein